MWCKDCMDQPLDNQCGDCLYETAKRLKTIVAKLPKCWGLNAAGELVQDVPLYPEMKVFCWCRKGFDGPHRITDSWIVVSIRRVTVEIKKGQTVKRVVSKWLYNTLEAAKAAKGGDDAD